MVTAVSNIHMLFLGNSDISPGEPPGLIQPAIKQFEVFYDERVVVGFHVVALPGNYEPNGGNE